MNEVEYNAIMAKMQAAYMEEDAAKERLRPSVLFMPKLYRDGTQWCALYGENIQEGVCGFGDTADAAMRQFDFEWLNRKAVAAMEGKS